MKEETEMTRRFHVVANFAQFQTGEEVEATLCPDYLLVDRGDEQLKVPYSEIQYVAHCERQDAQASQFLDLVPFAFGMGHSGGFAGATAASFGIDAIEHLAAPKDFYKNLFLVGYYEGGKEDWVILQDERIYDMIPFVQSLAARANTRVIHYLARLEEEAESLEANPGLRSELA